MRKIKNITVLLLYIVLLTSVLPEVSAQNVIPAPKPGQRTIKNLLATAVQPIGKTMYVWAGGHTASEKAAIQELTQ